MGHSGLAVLTEHGPGGFTVDEVAARAGCGRATVDRRWIVDVVLDGVRRRDGRPG